MFAIYTWLPPWERPFNIFPQITHGSLRLGDVLSIDAYKLHMDPALGVPFQSIFTNYTWLPPWGALSIDVHKLHMAPAVGMSSQQMSLLDSSGTRPIQLSALFGRGTSNSLLFWVVAHPALWKGTYSLFFSTLEDYVLPFLQHSGRVRPSFSSALWKSTYSLFFNTLGEHEPP